MTTKTEAALRMETSRTKSGTKTGMKTGTKIMRGAFSNDHFEEKPAWVRQKKEAIKTFKFFPGMFFRALNGMPKSKTDVEERDAIAFFAAFDGVSVAILR